VIADARPRAFCGGVLQPRVYVSTWAMAILDGAGLNAVLAHERHHARRFDPLRLAAGRVLARALFFLPELGELVEHQQALAELSADESAVNALPANRFALAEAMLSFSDTPASGGSTGIDPARVDYLLGESPRWRFPVLLCLAAASVLPGNLLSDAGIDARPPQEATAGQVPSSCGGRTSFLRSSPAGVDPCRSPSRRGASTGLARHRAQRLATPALHRAAQAGRQQPPR
jgi:Peptidase family M48